jgi:hypothetical protein
MGIQERTFLKPSHFSQNSEQMCVVGRREQLNWGHEIVGRGWGLRVGAKNEDWLQFVLVAGCNKLGKGYEKN